MSNAYVFVIAAALAVVFILFNYKICMDSLKENPADREKIQTRFFIWVGVSEIIPLILIVFGFMNLTTVSAVEELYTPGLIVIVLMGFAALFIVLQRMVGVPKEAKVFVNSFSMIALGLANSIPIIAIISIVLMMP